MLRVPFSILAEEFRRVLTERGVPAERAELIARLFAENQRDGIYSHGLNRFPGFVANLDNGVIDPSAGPEKAGGLGALEQWDGKMGLGPWNARAAMNRAIELAREHGLGCVGLRNTNHWLRAGAYALQAAEAGCIGICWTNTIPLMPPWGSAEVKIGNNPLAIAVPRADGPLLLDMAMSQYSNGKLEVLRQQGKRLPLPGGYNAAGSLTDVPGEILAARRALPIGYWKGSALAIMLDAVAALVAGGKTTQQIGAQGTERGVSQIYLVLNAAALAGESELNALVNAVVDDLHTAAPLPGGERVRYPGEGMIRTRQESLQEGLLVDEEQFAALRRMGI